MTFISFHSFADELSKIAAPVDELAQIEAELETPEELVQDTKFGRYLMEKNPGLLTKTVKSGTPEGNEVSALHKQWQALPPEPLPAPAPMPAWTKKRGLFKRADLNDGPAEGLEEIEETPPHPVLTAGKTVGGVALGTGLGVGLGALANKAWKTGAGGKSLPKAVRYGIPVLGAASGLGYSALQGATVKKMKEDMAKRKELRDVGQAT